ncbi:polyphosphate kinase 1 [Iningainema tapete]|uniref:Polyphosphate kinase n=1 Tax=Iningainema tapete BLCC-T55 TaxID=2748662 RepID=A0A8J6XDG1_9CYAN|nr:polyphosphate kinase 1 [Iningainema tapete]MBD2773960.1 polyphosphate kinase 1 [Iningainema tapete BLCC-T55]
MAKVKQSEAKINLNDPQYYHNQELSWLEFNNRVLHEALDQRTPLLERLKFTAIFSSNLDEFFMVRVSGILELLEAQASKLSPDGRTPEERLDAIAKFLHPVVTKQHRYFEQELTPQLAKHGIHLLKYSNLNQEQRFYLQTYFKERVFPVITPLAIDTAHPFPRMSNLSLNLAVEVQDPETKVERFARVKVPNILPRFVAFPKELLSQDGTCVWAGVALEEVIANNLELLFPGMKILGYHMFRITRDADFPVQEDATDDLMVAMQQEIRKRRIDGFVVRLEIQASTPTYIRERLIEELEVKPQQIYEVEGLMNLNDLMSFMALPLEELKDKPWTPVIPPRLKWVGDVDPQNTSLVEVGKDFFAEIRHKDMLIHHPYESFNATVQQFIIQAANDPDVLAIKMTLYRTSGDSPIVQALMSAAENEKQVVALVELKARFDEENNMNWARKLENVGVHVVYGVVGLKTHTKIVLVVRSEGSRIRRYVHIGTGNYNPKTARLYTDLGLLSCQEDLGADLTDLFNYLTGFSRQQSYRKLLVAPLTLRDRMLALIYREIEHCRKGHTGRIIAKMNSLVDPQIITALYEASVAGVQIDLIVRGMCSLRPGLEGVSENIRVISIIGRFLEHSRIFYFHNNGHEEFYIGSADWMPRNLDRRVEAVTPVEDPDIAQQLKEILEIMLADNRQAWDLHLDGKYIQRHPHSGEEERSSQNILMQKALQQ